MLYNDHKVLHHESCYSCNQHTHLTSECPLINPTFNKSLIISRLNFSRNQKRSKFSRAKNKNRVFVVPSQGIYIADQIEENMSLSPKKFDQQTYHFSSKFLQIGDNNKVTIKSNNNEEVSENINFSCDSPKHINLPTVQNFALIRALRYQTFKLKNEESFKSLLSLSKSLPDESNIKSIYSLKSKLENLDENSSNTENSKKNEIMIFEESWREMVQYFEKMSVFENYFSHGNFRTVLNKLNRVNRRKQLRRMNLKNSMVLKQFSHLSGLKKMIRSLTNKTNLPRKKTEGNK